VIDAYCTAELGSCNSCRSHKYLFTVFIGSKRSDESPHKDGTQFRIDTMLRQPIDVVSVDETTTAIGWALQYNPLMTIIVFIDVTHADCTTQDYQMMVMANTHLGQARAVCVVDRQRYAAIRRSTSHVKACELD
jgi:hypothetical protein